MTLTRSSPADGGRAPSLHTRSRIEAAADRVRAHFSEAPDVALILGTGLGGLTADMAIAVKIPYEEIPDFPVSTVESHAGQLLCGSLGGKTIVAMQGRMHRYEGYSLQEVTFPVRVLQALGARDLLISNAGGSMHPLWSVGELMLVADHINLLGDNPLIGQNDPALGPRFPDMSEPYAAELRSLARSVALEAGILLREGVYVAVTGPSLETRAEYRFLRGIGADVVGMSTVPEVIVAVQGGMRVLAVSVLTDRCLPDALEPTSLDAILEAAARAEPQLRSLMTGVVERL
jgi:purine-nucleoside phosphorylase